MSSYLVPSWPAPERIKAYCTTRLNGHSVKPYESFNLGEHVGDKNEYVQKNREKLQHELELPAECLWLNQIHGNTVISSQDWCKNIEADGCYSNQANQVCTVMTADCLSLLICDKNGTEVMALHGGWRSLAAGIIEKGIKNFNAKPIDILVWLGPCISQNYYEVGTEVREQFLDLNTELEHCFKPSPNHRWLLNLCELAKIQFHQMGATNIYGGDHCTFSEKNLFFSHRRDKITGRMAAIIYRSK